VDDMAQPVKGLIVHRGEVVEGVATPQGEVTAMVDLARRRAITRNHTGTHLLHAALRNNLGTHVEQRGSLVAPNRLRFDFVHDEKVTEEEIQRIEDEVNRAILANYPVKAVLKPYKQAVEEGAMALFGEKYSDEVRTVFIGDDQPYSYELCGGVHVRETGEIGFMVVVSEGSSSAGIRRVEALTGEAALQYTREQLATVGRVAAQLNTTPDNVPARIQGLQDELTEAHRQLDQMRREVARSSFNQMIDNLEHLGGVPALVTQLEGIPMNTLREMADWFRDRVPSGVVVLGTVIDDKPQILVSVSDDLTKQGLHAGNIVREVAKQVGGGGGGRPNMAQAGGKDAAKLPDALDFARQLIADSYKG
jgi:alanyl-tRNA synthetase